MIEATDVTTTILFLCSVLLVALSWKVWQLVGVVNRQRKVLDGLVAQLVGEYDQTCRDVYQKSEAVE